MLVSSNVLGLRCWFRMTLTVNRFEPRNRNRPTIPIILCTTNNDFARGLKSSNYDRSKYSKASSIDNNIKLWSAGCSSGEEAYSIAIAVSEALGNMKKWWIKILATAPQPRSWQKPVPEYMMKKK